jgi:predicted metalloprotease with PDZ domain
MAVFGEFPAFEPGAYTFLLDYSAWGEGDGMEHRNSTLISEPGLSLRDPSMRVAALDTIAHEFFHTWNVERIRPAGLEPFDLTRENITCCLWLAEGFTQYYGELLQVRVGAMQDPPLTYAARLIASPARSIRSAVEMSEHAPFADAATSIDRNDDSRTFMSYYEVGAAVALAMDLTIREKTAGRASLDDFMRLLWQRFGKTAEARPGYVGRPYTLQDLRATLGEVLNDRALADQFFDRYVQGHDVADYQALLAPAGFAVKPRSPGESSAGEFQVQDTAGGLLVAGLVPFGTPAYDAGLDLGDVITSIDGQRASSATWAALRRRAPGSSVPITIKRRDGKLSQATLTMRADPAVVIEDQAPLTPAQTAFRKAWLGSRIR